MNGTGTTVLLDTPINSGRMTVNLYKLSYFLTTLGNVPIFCQNVAMLFSSRTICSVAGNLLLVIKNPRSQSRTDLVRDFGKSDVLGNVWPWAA